VRAGTEPESVLLAHARQADIYGHRDSSLIRRRLTVACDESAELRG